MSREIKFRAWNGKNMIENVAVINGFAAVWRIAPEDSPTAVVEIDGSTHYLYSDWDFLKESPEMKLMQYIGFGIHEGDFVDVVRDGDEEFTVRVLIEDIRSIPNQLYGSAVISRKVIGNIYQNPELNGGSGE